MKTIAFALLAAGFASAASLDLVEAAKSNAHAAAMSLAKRDTVTQTEADGTTALHWAVRNDDIILADRLIKLGADVKATNRFGVSPIYLAALNGSGPVVEMLLKAGADADSVSTEGETALMTAAHSGSLDAVRALLAHGAKVDARETWRGQTALMWAASEGHPDMVKLLIDKGADVNAQSATKVWERQVTSEPRDKWLPPGGFTPLLFASRDGCLECVKILADAGANIQVQDPDGLSAPLIALINGHYDVAGFLVDRGTNPNLYDKTGRGALYAAVDFNTMPQSNRPAPEVLHNRLTALDVIGKLLEHGAEVNHQLLKQPAYRAKLDRGDDTMFTTGTTPVLRAAKAGDIDAMRLLLARGADVKLTTRPGINALMAAAGLGTKEEDATGRFKTEEQAIEAIRLCLEAGADINAQDSKGQTALHGAAFWGKNKVIEYLASRGADINHKDAKGLTAKDAALGLAGGLGFDGGSPVVRPETAELLDRLAKAPKK